ncbi:protein tyrosine phosphatase domain-containing protein 1 isoform X2 [Phacochoerus africanus]|uniref:protein tyrosine phosphatase domain-containing protein 1 isoform X2 n=1 Tax=Phacochoerus africanus TaxID=41426 RepID=UPI001FD8B6DF|nr:protein tyrosine phosphatase domain-containing protein 1 isoform X2 [Phacochoerus africanus]
MSVRSRRVMLTSQCNFMEQAGADISSPPALPSWKPTTMQDPPRRLSAVPFLSSFFQGRRHSASDPIVRLQQGRHSSAGKMLSSSSLQVMVAVSSVSCAERNPTYPGKRNSGRPTPKYTKVGERLRHVIPGHMACSMACGGKACKYENAARWSEQEQAIKGVYSSWVTDNILAMARPSTELLEKYCIIEQFQSHGIKSIINLQRPGEHASCGNPLEQKSGFTYLPEAFMEAGSVLIACYLVFATRMTADQAIIFVRAKRPNSIQTRGQLLCVREFTQFLIPLRNVFSCCDPKAHAVTLGQYLIRQRHLLHGYEARLLKHIPKIIHLICKLLLDLAEDRPVITEDVVEVPGLSAEIEKTVSEMVTRQLDKELLRHGSDASDSFTPNAVVAEFSNQGVVLSGEQEFDPLWKRRNVECLQPLTRLKRRLSYSDSDLKRAESLLEQGRPPWTGPPQVLPCCNSRQQKPITHCYSPQSPQLDLDKETLLRNAFSLWNQAKFGGLEGLKDDRSSIFHRTDIPKEVQRSRTFSSGVSGSYNPGEPVTPSFANIPKEPNSSHQQVSHCGCETHSGCGSSSIVKDGETCHHPVDCGSSPKAQDSKDLSEVTPYTSLQSELSVEARRMLAAKALANLNGFAEKEEVKKKVEMWQKELNSRDGAWERICGERDPFILCSLMWSWMEQLKEPVITKEDVDMLVDRCADAAEALFLLEKGQQQTVLCVLHCIVGLQTIPADVEEAVLARAIKAFTKVNFDSENGPIVYSTLKKIFKNMLEEKRKMTKDGPKPDI